MAITINDLNTPAFVTNFVRSLLFPDKVLGDYFPRQGTGKIAYKYNLTGPYQEPAVPYSAWDAEAPIGSRPGVVQGTAELLPLRKKKIMGEEMSLRIDMVLGGGPQDEYVRQAFADIENMVEGIESTWEFGRGQLLSTGTITLDGPSNGSSVEMTHGIDYGVPVGNKVTAATLWSDVANSDIVGNLQTWVEVYRSANRGLMPGEILISRKVLGYILRNAGLRSQLFVGAANAAPSVLAQNAAYAQLEALGLPPIRVIDEQVTNAAGTYTNVLPDNKIIMVPPRNQPLGYTMVGPTPLGLDLVESNAIARSMAPGISAQSWTKGDPGTRFNYVEAVGMPVLSQPKRLLIGTVSA